MKLDELIWVSRHGGVRFEIACKYTYKQFEFDQGLASARRFPPQLSRGSDGAVAIPNRLPRSWRPLQVAGGPAWWLERGSYRAQFLPRSEDRKFVGLALPHVRRRAQQLRVRH